MIEVVVGDITKLEVDVVVNAANSGLRGGGGVDGAIHRAAGPKLIESCRALGGCPTGEARVTPGFDLKAKWIVHAVGPIWAGGGHGEALQLESCYEESFRLAQGKRARSIAFPAISTGVYGYPQVEAAEIATMVMQRHAATFDKVLACCFSKDDATVYHQLLLKC